jgi:hypothetical protein
VIFYLFMIFHFVPSVKLVLTFPMARRFLPILASQLLIFFFISSFSTTPVTGEDGGFARRLDRKLLGLKKEKLSHFRFYWHDIVSGNNPSAVLVVPPAFNTSSGFGLVRMIDDPLTLGPKLSSKLVGKAQGFYASASQQELGLLMVCSTPDFNSLIFLIYLFDNIIQLISLRNLWYYGGW